MIAGLLDRHPLLWALADDERLSASLRTDLARNASRFGVSDVSLWEMAIKRSTGKLRIPDDLPRVVADLGFHQVPITRAQVWAVGDLPLYHRDPFDRLLVAQARDLGVALRPDAL